MIPDVHRYRKFASQTACRALIKRKKREEKVGTLSTATFATLLPVDQHSGGRPVCHLRGLKSTQGCSLRFDKTPGKRSPPKKTLSWETAQQRLSVGSCYSRQQKADSWMQGHRNGSDTGCHCTGLEASGRSPASLQNDARACPHTRKHTGLGFFLHSWSLHLNTGNEISHPLARS